MSIGKKGANQVPFTAEDHRDSRRERRYKGAKLVFDNDQSAIDCLLRDISATGARVRLGSLFDGPKQIDLRISDGFTYSADVMWIRKKEVGLRFHGEAMIEMAGKLTTVQRVLDQAKALPVEGLLQSLSTYRDFTNDELRHAEEELTAAHERVIEILRALLHSEEKKDREEQ